VVDRVGSRAARLAAQLNVRRAAPHPGCGPSPCAHTGYGIAAIAHVAETSRVQGQYLYGTDVGERLRQALGFHSTYRFVAWETLTHGGSSA
jgi:hypothetical protein